MTCKLRFAALLAVLAVWQAGEPPVPSVADVQRLFLDPPSDSRAMMRWWWFGPSATNDELDAEMRHMKEGGLGGFEVATVYPLAVDDPAHGFKNYPYLSPEHLDRIAFTARRARELGLRMDLTIGSGWSYGGPYITPALAATRLRSDRREIAPGVSTIARPAPYETDRLVAAFIGRGSAQEADPASFREVQIPADGGPIRLPPGDGPRVVLFYFAGQTGQVVKRAASGAEGYILDHYQRAAIEKHLREAGDKLLTAAGGAVGSVFCDSLEVYDADWTADLLAEFRTRRGYDLRPVLPLAELGAGDRAERVRRDYGQTLSELFEERFLVPMHEWAAKNRLPFRIQNYGMPPATLASYRHADIFDGEGFEWRTLSATRWASSASHLFNRPVTSSETWTWLHSPAFRATPLDLKAEADLHFLSGINQLVGHGWPYSPPQAGTPGWMFYAAGVYSDKNPWWPVMPDLSTYLQRVSAVLRQGEPSADIALYAPTEDAWALMRPGSPRYLNLYTTIRDLVGPRIVPAILDAGHSFDLIDDRTLDEAKARGYRLIVLPGAKRLPDGTKRWLDDYVARGGRLLAVKRAPDGDWPRLEVIGEDDLSARLATSLRADVNIEPPTPEIGFVQRRLRDGDLYFLANTSNRARTVNLRFHFPGGGPSGPRPTFVTELWNPMTGTVEAMDLSAGLTVSFEPYGSFIVTHRRGSGDARPPATRRITEETPLRSGWTWEAGAAARGGPIDLPHTWTDAASMRFYSGTVRYRRDLPMSAAARAASSHVFVDFGEGAPVEREALAGGTMRGNSFAALVASPIREAATVFINGQRAGTVWAPPYRVEVTRLLRDGTNQIAIDVYNTAINQLAEGGRLPDVNAVVERYGQRFRLQDLDNLQPIPSGILSVPTLVVER